MDYGKHFSKRETHQNQPIPGRSDMVPNNAGGFAFQLDDWGRLDRFLILGSEKGTYYVSERELTVQNAETVLRCLNADGRRVVDRVVEISKAGRAPKNDAALFVLALAASTHDAYTRQYAMQRLHEVARTGTHLFQFISYVLQQRGWGRVLRNGVANWYTNKPIDKLAYQVTKYRNRFGWTHADVLRMAHPEPQDALQNVLFGWITSGTFSPEALEIPLVKGFYEAQNASTAKQWANIIKEYKLPREALPTQALNEKEVWAALLEDMPMTALIRNLGNMSKVGLLVNGAWGEIEYVCSRLRNKELMQYARIHPVAVLSALKVYASGQGFRGSGNWEVVQPVVDALDDALYLAFDNVEPSNKALMLGVDISGSMGVEAPGVPMLTARDAAAVMALATAKSEPRHAIYGFSHDLVALNISPNQRMDDVLRVMSGYPFGRTDCALPMIHALNNGMNIEAFVIYTDSETWYGRIHPIQALQKYRELTGIPAKMIVVAMCSNHVSIADPNDPLMLDVAGFDTSTPAVISQFVAG